MMLIRAPCRPPILVVHHHSRSDIAHLNMRIVETERVGQSARILPIHVKEGFKRGKSTSFFIFVSGRN